MKKETKLLSARHCTADSPAIKSAGEILKNGGLVAFPTETVYGIGANALDPQAVSQIFAAKGRPQDNPLIVHIAELGDAVPLVTGLSQQALRLAGQYWPGPLTIILPKSGLVPGIVSAGLSTVALRIPASPIARAVIKAAGVPIAAPSANLSGKPSPTTAAHCQADLWGRVELILDGGTCPVGVESTVLSLAGPVPRLLRPGAVTLEELRTVLGEVVADPAIANPLEEGAPPASPGMKYKHYAPNAQVVLVHAHLCSYLELLSREAGEGVWALVFEEDLAASLPVPALAYGSREDSASQARGLFAALRELDAKGARQVFARAPSKQNIGLAVYNRLIRAAGFSEITL